MAQPLDGGCRGLKSCDGAYMQGKGGSGKIELGQRCSCQIQKQIFPSLNPE
jgi:hypothetical protein